MLFIRLIYFDDFSDQLWLMISRIVVSIKDLRVFWTPAWPFTFSKFRFEALNYWNFYTTYYYLSNKTILTQVFTDFCIFLSFFQIVTVWLTLLMTFHWFVAGFSTRILNIYQCLLKLQNNFKIENLRTLQILKPYNSNIYWSSTNPNVWCWNAFKNYCRVHVPWESISYFAMIHSQ